jgi:hypothetical protein
VALPTGSDLKTYLRIEQDAEDQLLNALVARAKSMLEAWMDVPITAETLSAVDRADALDAAPTSLVFPRRPIALVSVTDGEGVTVSAANYWVDGVAGMLWGKADYAFVNGPYTITASCGLSLLPRWEALEPVISQCILDLAADLYQRRTPGAASETGAGTNITWDVSRETVARVLKTLRTFKLPVAL